MASPMRTISLPSGERIPVLGQGTWNLGECAAAPRRLSRCAVASTLGMTLIDTAEMYADGDAERLVGEAIAGRRDEVFLVTKVLPHHATPPGHGRPARAACGGSAPTGSTCTCCTGAGRCRWRRRSRRSALQQAGLIRYWGVSNFDGPDMNELTALPGGDEVATDQVLYNLSRRAPELNLFPMLRQLRVPIMAYSPIEQGRILGHPVLREIAGLLDASPGQIALAWVLRRDDVCAIPRASRTEHINENRAALDIQLDQADLAQLDQEFPPPLRAQPLEVL